MLNYDTFIVHVQLRLTVAREVRHDALERHHMPLTGLLAGASPTGLGRCTELPTRCIARMAELLEMACESGAYV